MELAQNIAQCFVAINGAYRQEAEQTLAHYKSNSTLFFSSISQIIHAPDETFALAVKQAAAIELKNFIQELISGNVMSEQETGAYIFETLSLMTACNDRVVLKNL